MFVDCHCHLNHPPLDSRIVEIVEKCREGNVLKIFNTAGSFEENFKVIETSSKFKGFVHPVLGISPHSANEEEIEDKLEKILTLIEKERPSAIGEIGLDFHFDYDRKKQFKLFESQLQLAQTLDLPVMVHSRGAERECLEKMTEFKVRGAFHFFLVPELVDEIKGKFLISIPTIKSKKREKVIKKMGLEGVLCETDSPFAWNGVNEPSNVVEVYDKISSTLHLNPEAVQEKILENVENFFRV
ncbi:MAG: TatD family hydrolase [Candidatus Marsarchaeota archaeon]|nr:TatD family hydrolase [Candidatus Marsarchaeota archaeon]